MPKRRDNLNIVTALLEKQLSSDQKRLDKASKETIFTATRNNLEESIRQVSIVLQLIDKYEIGALSDNSDDDDDDEEKMSVD